MEQRHDDEDGILGLERHAVGGASGEGMQQRGAVAVENALGISGRSRRVAERAGRVLVEGRPFIIGRGVGQQRLVAQQVLDVDLRHVLCVAERDPALHQRQVRSELFDQSDKVEIEENVESSAWCMM